MRKWASRLSRSSLATQGGAGQPAEGHGPRELRPVGSRFAALDLHHLVQQRPVAAGKVRGHRGALRFEAQAAPALPVGADPQVLTNRRVSFSKVGFSSSR